MAIRQTWRKDENPTGFDDYDRRMRNWQRWRLGNKQMLIRGNSPNAYTLLSSGIYNRTDPRQREAIIPLLIGEAEDTEAAIHRLEPGMRKVVEVFYLAHGSLHRKARLCGCRRERVLLILDMARRRIMANLRR